MTGSQKALKVISIIVIILSILTIAAGVLLLLPNIAYVNAGYPSMDGADQNQIAAGAAIVMALCVIVILAGVIDLIVGILGLRGAKDPKHIGAFFIVAVIGLILAIVNVALNLFAGQTDMTTLAGSIVNLILMLICVILANNVRNLRNRIYDQGFRQQQR